MTHSTEPFAAPKADIPYPRNRWWWLLSLASATYLIIWFVVGLPVIDMLIGSPLGVGGFGRGDAPTIIAYWKELSPAHSAIYFSGVILMTAGAQLASRTWELGMLWARGKSHAT